MPLILEDLHKPSRTPQQLKLGSGEKKTLFAGGLHTYTVGIMTRRYHVEYEKLAMVSQAGNPNGMFITF